MKIPEMTISEVDANRMLLEIAAISDNPSVMDAMRNLAMLIKMVEPHEYEKHLDYLKIISVIAGERSYQINKEECYELIDDVLKTRDNHSIFALENFIDVARSRRKTSPKKKSGRVG